MDTKVSRISKALARIDQSDCYYTKAWPLTTDQATFLNASIYALFEPSSRGSQLWSEIGAVFSLGSGSSYKLCRYFGLDPEQKVRRRR